MSNWNRFGVLFPLGPKDHLLHTLSPFHPQPYISCIITIAVDHEIKAAINLTMGDKVNSGISKARDFRKSLLGPVAAGLSRIPLFE